MVQVLGDGQSMASLLAPYTVPFDDALVIGRGPRARATSGATAASTAGAPPLAVGPVHLIVADRRVSARHACIARASAAGTTSARSPGEAFLLEDTDSTNGTFIDGVPVSGPTPIRDGSLVFLGSHALVFRLVTPAEQAALEEEAARPFGPFATRAPKLALATARLRGLARSGAEILLVSETGVGRRRIAEAIHAFSGRPGTLVALDASEIPRRELEARLFGSGVWPAGGGSQETPALLDGLAGGGTLFVDDIDAVPHPVQERLLRIGLDRRLSWYGATSVVDVEVQVVAGTNRVGLGAETSATDQRPAPAWRSVQPVVLPPLRERVEDIGPQAAHILRKFVRPRALSAGPVFEPGAWGALLLHNWPLNLNELSEVLQTALEANGGGTIGREHLPDRMVHG
jgi:DNA-binding NtrC family response regulator